MKATISYITYKDAENRTFNYTTKTTDNVVDTVRALCSLLTNVKRGLPRTVEEISGDDDNVVIRIKTANTRVTLGTKKDTESVGFDD